METTRNHNRCVFQQGLRGERGAILVLTGLCLFAFLSFFAFVADFGHIFVTKSELQTTADSAALAAVMEFAQGEEVAREKAVAFGQSHRVANAPIVVQPADVTFGFYDLALSQFHPGELPVNGVEVRARRTTGSGSGALPLFFAPLFGDPSSEVQATARAVIDNRISGLNTGNRLLPYSVIRHWVDRDESGEFDIGSVVDIFPQAASPGNFGFLDLDGGSNGTPDLRSWITDGYAGDFVIPPGGSLPLPGNPGIHGASLLGAFQGIIGEVKFLPVHDAVTGCGNNTVYNVIAVIAVRILEVQLTGSPYNRHIYVELIQFNSSDLVINEEAPPTTGLGVPRLAV